MQSAADLIPDGLQGPLRRLIGEGLMPDWLRRTWFKKHGVSVRAPSPGRSRDRLIEHLIMTLEQTTLPMLLRYSDRNSMAHSVESRVPFLTPSLVELALSLPESHLIADDGTTKSVFRAAMRGIVPASVLNRRDKIGFATPEYDWLRSESDWVEGILKSDTARSIPAIDPAAMLRAWSTVRQGNTPRDFRVWRWLNLIRWAEQFQVEFDR